MSNGSNGSINTYDVYMKRKNMRQADSLWINNPYVLFDRDRLVEFIPTSDMNDDERLNALARFFIYLGVIMVVFYGRMRYIYLTIVAMMVLYVISYNYYRVEMNNYERFDDDVKRELGIKPEVPIKIADSGDICQMPTPDNPFMNVMLTDYTDNPNRLPACSMSDEDVKAESDRHFNYNLYKDVSDVWDRRNSQRQYVTMPGTTIPNDRDTFMKWCWKTTNVCRDGAQDACLQYEDLRVPGYS